MALRMSLLEEPLLEFGSARDGRVKEGLLNGGPLSLNFGSDARSIIAPENSVGITGLNSCHFCFGTFGSFTVSDSSWAQDRRKPSAQQMSAPAIDECRILGLPSFGPGL